MPFKANVFQVMIASPSDVSKERHTVRDSIFEWNTLHASDRECILLPVGWETHSSPEMGDRPQAIINKQLLNCDLLVGIFWTKLGTPTGEADSGTVEEIERHTSAGKPVMLYFSSAPVQLQSVDQEQYSRLIEFKEKCRNQGLIEEYESLSEFSIKFRRQLTLKINQHECFTKLISQSSISTVMNEHPALKLSKEAMELLLAVADSADGTILKLPIMRGLVITAGTSHFKLADARSKALWTSALEELIKHDLIRDQGHKGEVFSLTRDGYAVADTLRATGM